MEQYILLNGDVATRPHGQRFLEGEWTFEPPIHIKGGDYVMGVQDIQLELGGILCEVSVNLEYKSMKIGVGDDKWHTLANTLYVHDCEDLTLQIQELFRKLPEILETTVQNYPLLRYQANLIKPFKMYTNNFKVRYSDCLRRIMAFEEDQLEEHTETVSMGHKLAFLPPFTPMYVTLDIIEPNSLIPSVGMQGRNRNEGVLLVQTLQRKDGRLEQQHKREILFANVKIKEIPKIRLSMRYARSGNLIRTLGCNDRFTVGLILKRQLSLVF